MLCDNFMVSCINHKKMLTDNTPREDAIPEIRARRRTPGKVTYCVAGFRVGGPVGRIYFYLRLSTGFGLQTILTKKIHRLPTAKSIAE